MNLRELLGKASPLRSGDELAGVAAANAEQRARAQMALADVPLKAFLAEPLIPYEEDEVTRLICDSHDAAAFSPVAHLTVGEFRDWLLSEQATTGRLTALAAGSDTRNGCGCFQDHAAAGPGDGGRKVPRSDAVPFHHWPGGAAFDAFAAEPSHRRPEGNRRQRAGRALLWQRRCGDRSQSRDR